MKFVTLTLFESIVPPEDRTVVVNLAHVVTLQRFHDPSTDPLRDYTEICVLLGNHEGEPMTLEVVETVEDILLRGGVMP